MNQKYFDCLEYAFYQMKYESSQCGRKIGQLKRSNDPEDVLKFKYYLGMYFAIKFSMDMIWVIERRIHRFRDFDEYMIEAERSFARYCNALGQTHTTEMELMFGGIVEAFRAKVDTVNYRRSPEFYEIVKGKRDAYKKMDEILRRAGVYRVGMDPNVLYE